VKNRGVRDTRYRPVVDIVAAAGTEAVTATLSTGQLLLATVPSLIALVGLLIASGINARAVLKAEDVRARNALDAEDRRAQAAIDAEDRRHSNAVDMERRHRTVAARHDVYIEIEDSRQSIVVAAAEFRFPTPGLPDENWLASAEAHIEALESANRELSGLRSKASLYGSETVDSEARRTVIAVDKLCIAARRLVLLRRPPGSDGLHEAAKRVYVQCDVLRDVMRSELGSDA